MPAINSINLRKYLPFIVLGVPVLILLVFLYFFTLNKTSKTTKTASASTSNVTLEVQNNKDLGFTFSYFPSWKVTQSTETTFNFSKNAVTYDFTSVIADAKGNLVKAWNYRMVVNVFDKSDPKAIAKSMSPNGKITNCTTRSNCIVVTNSSGNLPIQAVIKGINHTVALGFYDLSTGKTIAAEKAIGPFADVFKTFKVD